MDGDGDMDALSASQDDNKIAWYQNAAGDGSAWTPFTITTAANGAWSVYAADVDGDGFMDVLSASIGDDHGLPAPHFVDEGAQTVLCFRDARL